MSSERTRQEISIDTEIQLLMKEATMFEKEYWDWRRDTAKTEAKIAEVQLTKVSAEAELAQFNLDKAIGKIKTVNS